MADTFEFVLPVVGPDCPTCGTPRRRTHEDLTIIVEEHAPACPRLRSMDYPDVGPPRRSSAALSDLDKAFEERPREWDPKRFPVLTPWQMQLRDNPEGVAMLGLSDEQMEALA